MRFKLTVVTLFVLTISGIVSCQNRNDLSKLISAECDSLLSNEEIHSISVGVLKNGKIYKFHKGELTNAQTPTDTTLYEIASLTKTFTGTLLAKAILDKKVGLDDDIRKYLPENLPNLEYNGHPITFRNLVTHTSGLPNMFPNRPEIFENPNWIKFLLKSTNYRLDLLEPSFWKNYIK